MSDRKPRGETQDRILAYIQSEIRERGYAPSVREIGEAVGLRSTSTVHGHLMRLEKKGLLRRDAMKPRAMGLSPEYFSSEDEVVDDVRRLPVVGRVAAGQPILAEENIEEELPIPVGLTGSGEQFILRVRGDSMIEAGILDGDYIVVRRQADAQNGEIVVALVEDSATVKRFYKENGHFRLQPENSTMEPIIVDEVSIVGKVVSLLRKM
ncbi:MAG: transcriptional repressor LexA [Clostridiales bacterium]|nr:transcriptional repressor LexA [Clostridiales bacterium]MDY5513935.1 transcriptional repressor LexA [Candidatus Ventricola sp.]